ncbi:Zinc finger protein CONSTANS-LIKE 10 [Camellia lanceoleosa]|uniref:Zinc finger protein CONSTANS-LIKE 10 n=1 Tax=Camellia lanceoleosa TaxID=1840588 RepID=A0ACC0FP47_9ERIC|nr:Zinc finger protein CONSTANS-LIKE 10 [Camellia lanceoleosa]
MQRLCEKREMWRGSEWEGHKRQTINCYSGCPSVEELSKIWSFVLESSSVDVPSREQRSGLLGVTDGNGDDHLLRQVSSATHIQTMLPTCSDSVSDDPVTNCNTDPTLCSQGQAYSSIPLLFASLTGESGDGDY